jgi:hypothetical protein
MIFGRRRFSFGSCAAFALNSDRAVAKCVAFTAELAKCAWANGFFLNFAVQSKRTTGLTITSPTSNCLPMPARSPGRDYQLGLHFKNDLTPHVPDLHICPLIARKLRFLLEGSAVVRQQLA